MNALLAPETTLFLLLTGLVIGAIGGALGLGGGILAAPVLLYLPPLLGLPPLGVSTVTGLTMVISLSSTVSGGLVHRRRGTMHLPLVRVMGGTMLVATFAGALLGRWTADWVMLGLLSVLAAVAAFAFVRGMGASEAEREPHPYALWQPVLGGTVIGVLGGIAGQSGAFLVMPALHHWLRLSTRVAVGTSLGVVFLSALGGTAGKILSAHAPLEAALVLAAGGILGGQLGAAMSQRLPVRVLRLALTVVIGFAAARLGVDAVLSARQHFAPPEIVAPWPV